MHHEGGVGVCVHCKGGGGLCTGGMYTGGMYTVGMCTARGGVYLMLTCLSTVLVTAIPSCLVQ